jgi:hypothetical protein
MGKAQRRPKKRNHLRLVEPSSAPPLLVDPKARREFAELTQRAVDIAIEIIDLVDGDSDLESNGDEIEDGDGV